MKHTVTACDLCGHHHEPGARIVGGDAVSECSWSVPPDGINGGKWKGDVCSGCRRRIHAAIELAVGDCTRAGRGLTPPAEEGP